ncbi:MAG: hypothetical protein PUC45_02250 [Oscillospiraceae bacterium]|nr:hypothetical protein [Oscillospiraceae bacterium]
MKMKAFSLALLCTLLLAACTAPVEEKGMTTLNAPAASTPEQVEPFASEPSGGEEDFSDPGGQGVAIDAYDSILRFFGSPDPESGYPEEFADAYIEDDFLYVCLTDTSEQMREKYRALVIEPRILRFVQVEHSYNDLMALHMALVEIEGLEFASVGMDVMGNEVHIGIPDISKEEEDRALIEKSLPAEIRERFEELPISFAEEQYATFG